MASFKIKKEDLKNFLKVCSMEGSIQFRDNKAIKKPMFSAFTIQVDPEGSIKVLTIDTHRKKTFALFEKNNVEVLEGGEIPITSYEAIANVLKGKGISGEITVTNNNDILILESAKDVYEIRQKISEDLETIKKDTKINSGLKNWCESHKYDGENDTLVIHTSKGDGYYLMRLKVNKKDLEKVVGDTLNITKDNKTELIFKESKLSAHKGEANATTKSKHTVDFEDVGVSTFEFDESFYSLQTIIPNLFDEIYLNIRSVQGGKFVTMYITSYNEKSDISISIQIGSIIAVQEE